MLKGGMPPDVTHSTSKKSRDHRAKLIATPHCMLVSVHLDRRDGKPCGFLLPAEAPAEAEAPPKKKKAKASAAAVRLLLRWLLSAFPTTCMPLARQLPGTLSGRL